MSVTFTELVTLEQINCGGCGATYALNKRYIDARREDGGGWHCPYCQIGWGYSNNNENAILRRALAEAERQARVAKCDAMKERIEKEQAQGKLNRTKNGVCPCCNRSFTNLRRHMRTKHKDQFKK
jgi:hypothetical protein